MLSDILNAASTDFAVATDQPIDDSNPTTEPLSEPSTSDRTTPLATSSTEPATLSRPVSYVPIRKNRVKWTTEETSALLEGLRKHGKDYSAICNDKKLCLNPCRRITDVRERIRCLHKNGLLPEDCRDIMMQALKKGARNRRLYHLLEEAEKDGGVEFAGLIMDIRKGSYDEPVVKMCIDGHEMTGWTSTTHFPKATVRSLLAEFVERTSSQLRIAIELVASLEKRPEEPIGEHVNSSRPNTPHRPTISSPLHEQLSVETVAANTLNDIIMNEDDDRVLNEENTLTDDNLQDTAVEEKIEDGQPDEPEEHEESKLILTDVQNHEPIELVEDHKQTHENPFVTQPANSLPIDIVDLPEQDDEPIHTQALFSPLCKPPTSSSPVIAIMSLEQKIAMRRQQIMSGFN